MLFIELLVPKGALDQDQRRKLGTRLTASSLLSGTGADPGVLAWYQSRTNVVVREEEIWIADDSAPRYVVNVYVGAWGKEMSEHLITRITRELAAAQEDSVRLPHAVVHVISIADGSYGEAGGVCRSTDALRMVEAAKTGASQPAPEGMVVDPVCGATIPLTEAVTLELDGETYGFCCPHCRGHFVKQRKEAAAP